VVGIALWVARVAVYAGAIRDEYPPFRLDRETVLTTGTGRCVWC
jgi:hypothetical protein